MYCSPWHATWTASCFFLAESSEGDDPYFLASWDIFPSLGPNRAVAWVSFHLQRSLHRDHISFISAPHRDLFPANAMSRFSEEKDLKHATIGLEKKHRSQPPDFARSTEFVRQYWINTNLTLAANNPHALTFAPSLILLASLQILAQRLMISSLPCQKKLLSLAKVRKAEHREQHKCSWVPCLPWVTFDPTNCSAVQTSGKQPLSEGKLPTHPNYLGKDAIKRPPFSWQKEIWIFVMKGKSPTVIAALRL